MIKTNTTFILGAGAHHDYGFPLSYELITEIISFLRKEAESCSEYADIIRTYSKEAKFLDTQKIVRFCDELEGKSHIFSIDNFLFRFAVDPDKECFEFLGKTAVAYVLQQKEKLAFSKSLKDNNWIEYLYSVMDKGCDKPIDFLDNKVKFITFNYDRFFEKRIWDLFSLNNNIKEFHVDIKDFIESIPVYHVYGDLGAHPCINEMLKFYKAAESIRLINDERKSQDTLEKIHDAISWSERVVFLGFSFDPKNQEVLQLDELLVGKRVYATHYGLTYQEFCNNFPAHSVIFSSLRTSPDKCLDFIKNFVQLN